MTTRTQSGLVAATIFIFSLFGAATARAQRAARTSGPPASAHAQPVSARVGTVRGTTGNRTAPLTRSSLRFNAASNTFVSGDGTVISPQDLLNTFSGSSSGYPGFAANNPNLGTEVLNRSRHSMAPRDCRTRASSNASFVWLRILFAGWWRRVRHACRIKQSRSAGAATSGHRRARNPINPTNQLAGNCGGRCAPAAGRRSIHSRAPEWDANSGGGIQPYERSDRLHHRRWHPPHARAFRSEY